MLLPIHANDYCKELTQDVAGMTPAPRLDAEGSVAAAEKLAESISEGKKEPLQRLVMHLYRVGYHDRCQPYLMDSVFELRRNDDSENGRGEKYSVRGEVAWYNTSTVSEQLLFD